MILEQMLTQLSAERSRIQAELHKLEKAINALEDLQNTQQERGISAAATTKVVGMQAG